MMYTLMAVVALTTSVSTATLSQNPTWLNDYAVARERVAAVGKPMAVFLGSGQGGWGGVVRDGSLDPAVNRLLADNRLMRELTGWKPTVPFQEGLRRAVDWMRSNIHRFDSSRFTR